MTGVFVGGTGVFVGGTGVAAGGIGVATGGTGVLVGGGAGAGDVLARPAGAVEGGGTGALDGGMFFVVGDFVAVACARRLMALPVCAVDAGLATVMAKMCSRPRSTTAGSVTRTTFWWLCKGTAAKNRKAGPFCRPRFPLA